MPTRLISDNCSISVSVSQIVDGVKLRNSASLSVGVPSAGAAKAARGLPVRDPSREEEKLESVSAMTEEAERPYIRELYSAIFRSTRAWEEEQPVPGEKN